MVSDGKGQLNRKMDTDSQASADSHINEQFALQAQTSLNTFEASREISLSSS